MSDRSVSRKLVSNSKSHHWPARREFLRLTRRQRLRTDGEAQALAIALPEAALTITTIPAFIASGSSGQAATTAARSGSSGSSPVAPRVALGRRRGSDSDVSRRDSWGGAV